jgi:hypothetical protein
MTLLATALDPRPKVCGPLHRDTIHAALELALACDDAGPTLRTRLERYARLLAAGYAEEEEPDDLLVEVLDANPALAPRTRRLRRLRRRILADLDALLETLSAPTDPQASWRQRAALQRALRQHRHEEERLLLDAHFQDCGGEG